MSGPGSLPTKTFDFALMTVTWGADLYGGLESIKWARAGDAWSTHVAADRTGAVTLTYSQNATALDYLSQQEQLDEATGGGVHPLEVKDGSGRSICTAPNAWVKKPADGEFQKDGTTREFVLECDQLTVFVGGLN